MVIIPEKYRFVIKRMFFKKAFLSFLLFLPALSISQVKVNVIIEEASVAGLPSRLQNLGGWHQLKDSAELKNFQQLIHIKFYRYGYPLVYSTYTCDTNSAQVVMNISPGKHYRWKQLKTHSSNAAFFPDGLNGDPLFIPQLENKIEKQLQYFENYGYPFAEVLLDSIDIDTAGGLSAVLEVRKNRFIRMDSLILKSKGGTHPAIIRRITGIRQGDPYSEKMLRQIPERIKETGFLKLNGMPEVTFTPDYTKLTIFTEKKKSNQFDGVIGFLPDNLTGKVQFTGLAKIRLSNVINRAESFDFDWRKLPLGSRDIKAKLLYPYLFGSPYGLEGSFKLFQRDTLFIDLQGSLGFLVALNNKHQLKVFASRRNLSLISQKGLSALSVLPEYADVEYTSYGLSVKMDQTDYKLNPTSGWKLNIQGSAGQKKIKKNININPELYNNIELSGLMLNAEWQADGYIRLFRKMVFNPGIRGAGITAPDLFLNEAFRIGGNQSLRGFDEESIYATSYIIGNLEWHYLLDQNSYILAFYSQSWLEQNLQNSYLNDMPESFGAGIVFETKAGLLNLTYAIGRQFDNPFILRAAKIHFGIVSTF